MSTTTKPVLAFDDVKLCNCARCFRSMLGDSMSQFTLPQQFRTWRKFGMRINGRPYCIECEPQTKNNA